MYASAYTQIGGFGAETNAWCTVTTGKGDVYRDNSALAKIICGPMSPLLTRTRGGDEEAKVELVLGITSSGASYLLMTYEQMLSIARKANLHPLRSGRYASEFVSLSPIEFRSVEELEKKLGRYTPKARTKMKGIDCSPANNRFVVGGGERPGRGAFEHARVFYRLLKNDLDVNKFSVVSDPSARSIRIFSLVFNTWNADTRPSKERLLRPKVLDIGCSEVEVPDLNVKEGTSLHLMLTENRTFGLKGKKKSDFDHGNTEMLDHGSIAQRLQELLETARRRPIVLLVNNAEATQNMLKHFGVGTSNFVLGIKALLHGSQPSHRSSGSSQRRSRSRSPRRQVDYYGSNRRRTPPPNSAYDNHSRAEYDPRDRPPTSSEQYSPIYVIDIRAMTQNIMDSGDLNAYSDDGVDALARILHVHYPLTGWCAGNESWELVSLWRSMISGPAIDEQRAMRENAVSAPVPGPSRIQGMEDDDPNDYMPAGTSGSTGFGAFDDVWDDDEED